VRIEGPLFLLVAAPNDRGLCRLGLTVGRRVGTAVERNRAKRVLRESFRRTMGEGRDALDLVLIPKRDILLRSQAEVDREYRESLRRLVSRAAARRRGQAAPAAD
jgi:ribonuclease P protein component